MASINNPAGRLYLLLTQLRGAGGEMPLIATWAQILDQPQELVREHLGGVAALITRIDAAVAEPGREQVAVSVARYREQWLEAIFPFERPLSQRTADFKPTDEAHEALGLVATILETAAPDGTIPPVEDRAALIEHLQALIQQVADDEQLPEEIAHLIVARLMAIEEALRHIKIGGPEAIRQATEALMGVAVASSTANEHTKNAPVIKNVMAVAASIYALFAAGPVIQHSLEAWPVVVQEITAGQIIPSQQVHAENINGIVDADVVETLESREEKAR